MSDVENRCRLVLIAPEGLSVDRLEKALAGGDVASLIVPRGSLDDEAYQTWLSALVGPAQGQGVAVIGTGERRIVSRAGADGWHVTGGAHEVGQIVEEEEGRMIIGANGGQTRHAALEMGEARPDYMFFGKFGADTRPEPHPKFVDLAGWWAEFVEIPGILLGGSDLATLADAASCGTDFVALSQAVFGDGVDEHEAVAKANEILTPFEFSMEE